MRRLIPLLPLLLLATAAFAQTPPEPVTAKAFASHAEDVERSFEETLKSADDVLWHLELSDVASVDKYEITSKPGRSKNPTGQGAGNPMIIPVYVFAPKPARAKAPMLVFVHGGVHGNFDTPYKHIVRELIGQGYVVIAPEYRGSTGYGSDFYEQIDYG